MEPILDPTEPYPMELGETTVFEEDRYLWHVELYLMSKYAPEFVEATIFKIRAAALERAKIVKEDHLVHRDISSLQSAIESDLAHHVQWSPQRSHRKHAVTSKPGIGKGYQRALDSL